MSLVVTPKVIGVIDRISQVPRAISMWISPDITVRRGDDLKRLEPLIKNYVEQLEGAVRYITHISIPISFKHNEASLVVTISNPRIEKDSGGFGVGESAIFEVKIGWGETSFTEINYGFERKDGVPEIGISPVKQRFPSHLSASEIVDKSFKEFIEAVAPQIDEWELSYVVDNIDREINLGRDVPSFLIHRVIDGLPDGKSFAFGDDEACDKNKLYGLIGSTGSVRVVRTNAPGSYSLIPAVPV